MVLFSRAGGRWDISNKQRIGFTEVELVQKMIDGITYIIAIEEKMQVRKCARTHRRYCTARGRERGGVLGSGFISLLTFTHIK